MQQVREIMSKDLKIASPEDTIKKRRSLWLQQIAARFPSEKMVGYSA
jgi:hypothetical protein